MLRLEQVGNRRFDIACGPVMATEETSERFGYYYIVFWSNGYLGSGRKAWT